MWEKQQVIWEDYRDIMSMQGCDNKGPGPLAIKSVKWYQEQQAGIL